MRIFKRKIKTKDGIKESADYYYGFQFDKKQYVRCAHTANKKLAKQEAEQELERLRKKREAEKDAAKQAHCKPREVVFCDQCRKPLNKFLAVKIDEVFYCGKACYEKWVADQRAAVIPTLRQFQQPFMKSVKTRSAEKPATIEFYKLKYDRLLEFDPLADARLDKIDEALVDSYVEHRRGTVGPATTNRELATLRKALRLAYKWNLINRVPQIQLLPGERNRTFVLSPAQERLYLERAEQPLRDAALLMLDTGLRVGEVLALQWSDVRLKPIGNAKFGFIHVRKGKSKNATRYVSLTARVRAMLEIRYTIRRSDWVFTDEPGTGPLSIWTLEAQHKRIKAALRLPKDAVIHSFRHTFGTRLGEAGADAFTIMKVMGHSSVTVSQKYVHPTPETMERAFERLQALNESRQAALTAATVENDELEPSSPNNVITCTLTTSEQLEHVGNQSL